MGTLPRRRLSVPAPFWLASVLAIVLVAVPPHPRSWLDVILAAALTILLSVAALLVPWRRLPPWTHATVPLLYFGVIMLLRDAQGGFSSGYAALTMLPVFWLALFGTRRQLAVSIALVGMVFLAPVLLVGGAEYPVTEWRRAVVWAAVAGLVGFWVQRLVNDSRVRAREVKAQIDVLKRAEARLAHAIASAPIGIATTDLDGAFVAVNPALCAFLGRAPDELVGSRAQDLSHPDDRSSTVRMLRGLAGGAIDAHQEERRYVHSDGSVVWALLSVGSARDEDGAPHHLVCHFDDITARKAVEEELRQSEAKLHAVGRVARELASVNDVRATICRAAIEVASAASAFLVEPDPGGDDLVVTTVEGVDFPTGARIPLAGSPSCTVTAFTSGSRVFVEDANDNALASPRLAALAGAVSALFEPIVRDGVTLGVLTVAWRRRIESLDDRAVEVVGLLAAEAAVALERESLMRRLEENARQDPLTGLPNRRGWEDELPRILARAARGEPLTMAMIDLDHFKRFNDAHGHLAGDDLLRRVALAWQRELRATDVLARYGGEEFVLALPACPPDEAIDVAERLRTVVPEGQTCSIGVAAYRVGETGYEVVARADTALYRAKALGRARVELAPDLVAAPSLGTAV